jgi:alginate O-acetyltransferase complex protein AlgI
LGVGAVVFSDSAFIFFFLPPVLLVYFGLLRGRSARNVFLTLVSLFFYAWGEPWFVFVMLASIAFNWLCALQIDKHRKDRWAKRWLALSVIGNLGLLSVFKYLMFILENLNWAFGLSLPVPRIILPIGISFFTFQAMSYVIDVYREDGKVQKHFMNVCLYIALFPQLIAGPIVRYQTIADEIDGRVENMDDFLSGTRRFIVGLGKKVILANSLALVVDNAFARAPDSLSSGAAWLGAIAYLWQVYYDFSGYSDMAIGLGRMFGFHFLENFDYPMISRSVTEFWRRWHISLGSWFRDYLFIPLGGSRVKSVWRLLFNMFVVWSLTGLWHGAYWKYLFWGIGFFVLLAFERLTGLSKRLDKRPAGILYMMITVITITVMIRADDMSYAARFIGAMYGIGASGFWDATAAMYLREYGVLIALALIIGFPVGDWIQRALRIPSGAFEVLRAAGLLAVFVVSISYIVMGGYNPFIYFNF